MKELKATLYDIKGYFIPGALFLWGIVELISQCGYMLDASLQKLPSSFMAVAAVSLSYVTGHALHTLANATIDKMQWSLYPPKFYFDEAFNSDFSVEQRQALQACIGKVFRGASSEYSGDNTVIRASYWACFQYVMAKQVDELDNFLSLTGFYRGTTAAFGATAIIYAAAFTWRPRMTIAGVTVVSAIACLAFFTRVTRFNHYLAKTVYANFLHLAEVQTAPES
ncbi:hypothetical protein [Geomonas propionica]|uniref:Uncharacterized protein n=1 Tax=Geomonas propionica TaxID=2798582 RepID=A0ABS0YVS2_9BACT|nr:hypothetical protein [Geomonas propionica]MBJ6802062.1 hypothetical protein [Geomonas propionica]